MRKNLVFVLFVFAVLFFGSFSAVFGEMMVSTIGVAKGDVFRYSYNAYYNSNNLNAVAPASFYSINQTDYFMVSVTGVSGSSVNFDTTLMDLNRSRVWGCAA